MRSRIVTTAALLALALALVASGCGSGSDQTFIDDYNKATRPLTKLNRDIAGTVDGASGASNSKIAKQFGVLTSRFDEVNRSLAKLDPPDDAKDPFADLRSALNKGTADLRNASRAAGESDTREFASATASLSKHSTEIGRAEDVLKKQVEG